ncbi:MAG: biotin--[acetyl-CoA-carboxylase] ligase [Bdellovibrionales bacterium]
MISTTQTTLEWARQRQIPILFQPQTGSTNEDAKSVALQEAADFVLYLTSHQTAGRGRGTHQWLDTGGGESLLSTWSYRLTSPPQAIAAPRVGLALFHAVRRSWPSLVWGIKAPNDLHLDGHKVGGLLLETVSSGERHRLLIGLGLNVFNHPRRFSEATHLIHTLDTSPGDGEWFQFLDELHIQLNLAIPECLLHELSESARRDLVQALNANPARPYVVQDISGAGDIIHSGGTIRWLDL